MRELLASAAMVAGLFACASTPDTPREKRNMSDQAQVTLERMIQKDPSLRPLLQESAGYAVFPEVGKGGFIAGAAHGQGVLYERGRPTGYVELQQGSIGAQIGAQTFAELLVLRNPSDVIKLKQGDFTVGGNASAVVLTAGVAGAADLSDGVGVFIMPRGGVMAELSVSGQRIRYSPAGG